MICQQNGEEGAAAGLLWLEHPLLSPRLLVVSAFFSFSALISFVVCSSSSVCRSFYPSFSRYPLDLLSGGSAAAATPPLSQRARKKYLSLHLATVHPTCTPHGTLLHAGTAVPGAAKSSCVPVCVSTATADAYSNYLLSTVQKPLYASAFSRHQRPIFSLRGRRHPGAAAQHSLLMNTRVPGGTRQSPLPYVAFDAAPLAAVVKARRCLLRRTSSPPCILSRALVAPLKRVVLAAAVVTKLFSPTAQDASRCHAAGIAAQNCTRLLVTWYATTAADAPIRENCGGTSSSLLVTRRRLFADAVLLLPTLFPGGRLLLKEGFVEKVPARGLVATAISTTTLFSQPAQFQKKCVPGGTRQKETKLYQKYIPVSFLAGGSTNTFSSLRGTPLHDYIFVCGKYAGATQTLLTAAAVVRCKEPGIITLPRLTQGHSKFSSCVKCLWRPPMLFPWPSSSVLSSGTSLCGARFTSSLCSHPKLCRRQRKCLLIQSGMHHLFPSLSAAGNNCRGFTSGGSSGLLCSPQNCERIASALADTLVSDTCSNAVALFRVLATGSSSSLRWLLLHLPCLLNVLRHFATCRNAVNLSSPGIHGLMPFPVTHKLADTLKRVATHFASLFASSRVCVLMEGKTSSSLIAAAAEATAECAAAAATFYSTCAVSLLLQKNMGVSCAAKTCKLFGVATVFAASNAAAGAASTMRYIIAALHSGWGTGNETAKLQFPSMMMGKLDRYPAEVEPLHGTTVQKFHSSASSLSQQRTGAAQFQASTGVAAKETGWTAETAALQQQARGLVSSDILADAGVQQQQGGLTPRGTVVGQTIQPDSHVTAQDMSLPSTCSTTGSLRTWSSSSDALHVCIKEGVLGCIVFWLLGGRFFRLSPSSLLAPGAYHQHHLSLRAGIDYASLEERRFIKKLGETFGCHTCGRRRGVEEWVADHQPPKSVVVKFNQTWLGWLYGSLRRAFGGTRYLPQRFYPQCKTCSSKQATVVKHNAAKTRKTDLIVNWNSLRAYHLTGGVLQFLRVLAGW